MSAIARTSKTLDCDVVIIGAGLIGLSCADSLLSRGASVIVVDRASGPMRGTSLRNSGMVHPSQSIPWGHTLPSDGVEGATRQQVAKDVLSLAKRSADLLARRAAGLGLAQTARARGTLRLYKTTQDWQAACAAFDALGIAYQRRPSGALFGERPAVFFPDDFSGNAYDYGSALAEDIAVCGAQIITGQAAALWQEKEGESAGRVIGVRLGNCDIRARHTVLAAGPQSGNLAARIGLDLPMQRVAGYALNYARPKNMDGIPAYPVMDADSYSALSVFKDHIRLSGTLGAADEGKLVGYWNDFAPQLMARLGQPIGPANKRVWRGERPVSRSGKPFIGRSRVPGLWLNTGHGHMGWTLCAGSGELMARMIVDGVSDPRFAFPNRT